MICSKFNVLPNNPALKDLTQIQRQWILANILDELSQTKAFDYRGKQVMGLDKDEFAEFSRKMRELAEKQHAATR